jgi:predicted transposase YdaD
MKTDPLFYELFQAAPQTFFELLQITPSCPYRFESITVKASERRMDGVFEPTVAGQPIYFLEVQAFPDVTIYFRQVHEVMVFFAQRPHLINAEWQGVVLWLDKTDDPGFGTLKLLARKPKPRLRSLDLIALLRQLPEDSLALNVLRPLLATDEREVRQHVVQWVKHIRQTPALDADTEERLLSVLSQLIEQKFNRLTYKELSEMLRLTPLRETTSVQEVLQEEHVAILTRQIGKKFALPPETTATINAKLQQLDLPTLRTLLDLIFDLASVEQLEAWIGSKLPQKGRKVAA